VLRVCRKTWALAPYRTSVTRKRELRQAVAERAAGRQQLGIEVAPTSPTDNEDTLQSEWVRIPPPNWQEDAAFANKAPPFLRSIASHRLDAIAALRKEAGHLVEAALPPTAEEVERCLRPAFSKYAEIIFDKRAEFQLGHRPPRHLSRYSSWLRSKCIPAVVDDIAKPIFGQLAITVRYVAMIIGEGPPQAADLTFRALHRILTEVLGGPVRHRMVNTLTAHLEGRIPYWEARATELNKQNRQAPGVKGPEISDPELAKRATARSTWLDQKLADHQSWDSDTDIATNGGPTYNTIQRYRSGTASTRELYVRRRIADAFQCEITDVPE